MKKNLFTGISKEIDAMEELRRKREHEVWDWKVKTCPAKWFYSLTDKERKILEECYKIVVQINPSVKWGEFIDLLRLKIH